MPSTEQAQTEHRDPRDKPNLIDGRLLIFGSAIGCVVLFFIVWGSLRSVEQHIEDSQPQLDWVERATWHAPAVIRATLVKPNAANAQYTYNKPRYRDPGLVIYPEEEKSVYACAELAASADFTNHTTQIDLIQHIGSHARYASYIHHGAQAPTISKNNFYAKYLLATWLNLHGDLDNADAQYESAIAGAHKIIVIRYTDPEGKPIPDLTLDRIEIGCDRVTDGGVKLDQRLVLVFPHQTTDKTGRVYLPVYDTTYRPVYLPQPEGYDVTYTPDEGWFKLPTRLGTITAEARKTDP